MQKDMIHAFPRPFSTDEHEQSCNAFFDQEGMTLRDFFAALAMAGLVREDGMSFRNTAIQAYKQADEMLKEREKERELTRM